ncbi:MAG: hypothetical protein AAF333_19100 [Planctomycetota bacterium]
MKQFKIVAAAAVVLGVAGTANAGSVAQSGSYSFDLNFEPVLQEPPLVETQADNLLGNVIRFAGSTMVEVQSFESILSDFGITGATMTGADLEAGMNVSGTIFAPPQTQVTGYAWGGLTLGPLVIDLDFAQYDGAPSRDNEIMIDEFDSGFDATEPGDDLSIFSSEPLFIEIEASFEYVYNDLVQLGDASGFTASGSYDLVYTFDESTNGGGDPEVVPTPSAAAAGLLAMAGLAARRRRSEDTASR